MAVWAIISGLLMLAAEWRTGISPQDSDHTTNYYPGKAAYLPVTQREREFGGKPKVGAHSLAYTLKAQKGTNFERCDNTVEIIYSHE